MRTAEDLIKCVEEMAEVSQEIEPPCPQWLSEVGAGGVEALIRLIEGQAQTDTETIPCYAAELIASFPHPSVVPALLRVFKTPFQHDWVRDEVIESVFNYACGNRALLDPSFVEACTHLRVSWQTKEWRIEYVDQFLRWAQSQVGNQKG